MEQSLTIRQSLETAPLIVYSGEKIEVIKQIIRVIEFFLEVTGHKLESYQIQVLAGDLYEKFRYESFEDILLMFKMARQGDFGKVYQFNTMVVMDWANAYFDKKSEERERLARSQMPEIPPKKEEKLKYFHELPEELQRKFEQIGSERKDEFLPRKATYLMHEEMHRRSLQEGEKRKPIKFKKYL